MNDDCDLCVGDLNPQGVEILYGCYGAREHLSFFVHDGHETSTGFQCAAHAGDGTPLRGCVQAGAAGRLPEGQGRLDLVPGGRAATSVGHDAVVGMGCSVLERQFGADEYDVK